MDRDRMSALRDLAATRLMNLMEDLKLFDEEELRQICEWLDEVSDAAVSRKEMLN